MRQNVVMPIITVLAKVICELKEIYHALLITIDNEETRRLEKKIRGQWSYPSYFEIDPVIFKGLDDDQ